MGKSFWIGGILLAGICFWGVNYLVTADNGDAEFQKTLDAMKQVKSFRGMHAGRSLADQPSERLWEVDCYRGIVHKQSQQSGANPGEVKNDEFLVGSDEKYTRNRDGSWQESKYASQLYSASWYCNNIAEGTVRDLLPDVRRMLRSATFGKGDKKTVNGVRCQEWKYSMHASTTGQRGTMCIGLDDHLPYEMITDNDGSYSYTDYNHPLQFEGPDAVLQATSTTGGLN